MECRWCCCCCCCCCGGVHIWGCCVGFLPGQSVHPSVLWRHPSLNASAIHHHGHQSRAPPVASTVVTQGCGPFCLSTEHQMTLWCSAWRQWCVEWACCVDKRVSPPNAQAHSLSCLWSKDGWSDRGFFAAARLVDWLQEWSKAGILEATSEAATTSIAEVTIAACQ